MGALALLLYLAQAARAEAPPSAPPAPPARAVVTADGHARGLRIEVQGHAALLRPEPEGLLTLDSATPGQGRWDALAYDPSEGGRLRATLPRGRGSVELAFTWWGSWSDAEPTNGSLASTATPSSPLNVAGAIGIGLREDATLWDVGVAACRPWGVTPDLHGTWGLGLRHLHFDERATFLFPTSVPPANAALFTTDIDAGLLAVEASASATWAFAPRLDATARGGLFAGWMRRRGSLTTTSVSPVPDVGGRGPDDLGYGAEVELSLRWHATPRLTLALGWGALVLGPVTRAHDTLDFGNVSSNDLGPRFRDDVLVVQRLFTGITLDL